MREHMGIFRGKRLDNGEWVEGGLMVGVRHELWQNKGRTYICVFPRYFSNLHLIEVDPDTVGECTGLRDKNGKLIFEGDICRVTRYCILAYGKITYRQGCFWFVDDETGSMLRLCDIEPNGFEIEIISTIHDNPELLKGGEGDG